MGNGHGGKRTGSGAKKGSRLSLTKQLLRDIVTPAKQKDILVAALKKAKDGDKDLMKFFLEQFYGKAPQQLDHNIDGLDEILTFRRSGKKDE